MAAARRCVMVLSCLWAPAAMAEPLFGGASTGPLLVSHDMPLVRVAVSVQRADGSSGSLFGGASGRSLFAPLPTRRQIGADTAVDRLRHLIARAEAGRMGYDAVQHGARVRPAAAPTQMTIAQIYAWIDATPGQPHAIGRYQFIPSTLRRLVRHTSTPQDALFSARVQDRLADVLLDEAGLDALQRGEMARATFMRNLARIWAGLPMPSGRSYYHGYAGNRATMSWADFDAEMARIFPG